MEGVTAHPLDWPEGRPRTGRPQRARFDQTFATARTNLLEEVQRLGGIYPVISSNVETRRDGLPYANRPEPEASGVAVYFTYQGRQVCFACDKWDRVRDNLQAIAKTIEALRGIDRWGTGDMVDRAFAGFEALPGSDQAPWWADELEMGNPPYTRDEAEYNFRVLARDRHPDRGGTDEEFKRLRKAIEEARQALAPDGPTTTQP